MTFGELIVWYLFLGGAAAGSFAVLSAVDLYTAFSRSRRERLARAASGCAGRRFRPETQRRVVATGG